LKAQTFRARRRRLSGDGHRPHSAASMLLLEGCCFATALCMYTRNINDAKCDAVCVKTSCHKCFAGNPARLFVFLWQIMVQCTAIKNNGERCTVEAKFGEEDKSPIYCGNHKYKLFGEKKPAFCPPAGIPASKDVFELKNGAEEMILKTINDAITNDAGSYNIMFDPKDHEIVVRIKMKKASDAIIAAKDAKIAALEAQIAELQMAGEPQLQ